MRKFMFLTTLTMFLMIVFFDNDLVAAVAAVKSERTKITNLGGKHFRAQTSDKKIVEKIKKNLPATRKSVRR